jgi:phosphopantothenoylcysteine decarboxylase/phosphopantothenate--cysteine ligase
MNILMLMTGSIACAKATSLISLWTKRGHNVTIIASPSALEFVGIATLEGLSGNSVLTSVFETNNMMEHINSSRKVDIIILAPATANSINKIANGIADDMISTTWIAALTLKIPMYIAPAMNTKMWEYPATQQSISKLQEWGINILSPQSGDLACGESGSGRMMEVEDIDKAIMPKKGKHLLLTAGGTREYIDGVRYIGNLSTGSTGAYICDFFTSRGYEVTWMGANNAIQPKLNCTKVFFDTFDELSDKLQSQLKTTHFDAIIHAAAISDFKVDSILLNGQEFKSNRLVKLPTSDTLCINLNKNPKLINHLKDWSINKKIQLIAFKLTNTTDVKERISAVTKLLNKNHINFVAHNDLTEITSDTHIFTLFQSTDIHFKCSSTLQLCHKILEKVL